MAAYAGARVTLAVEADGLARRLLVNGEVVATLDNVTYLADEGVRVGKRFTGSMVGVYAVKGTAIFENLVYAEADQAFKE